MYLNDITISTPKEHSRALEEVLENNYNYTKYSRDTDNMYSIINIPFEPDYDAKALEVVNTLNELDPENYAFIRFGSDIEDIEIHGNIRNFNLAVKREVINIV